MPSFLLKAFTQAQQQLQENARAMPSFPQKSIYASQTTNFKERMKTTQSYNTTDLYSRNSRSTATSRTSRKSKSTLSLFLRGTTSKSVITLNNINKSMFGSVFISAISYNERKQHAFITPAPPHQQHSSAQEIHPRKHPSTPPLSKRYGFALPKVWFHLTKGMVLPAHTIPFAHQ